MSFNINLPMSEIVLFTSITNKIMSEVWLNNGERKINAKSILGIHSVDFNEPILLLSVGYNLSDSDKNYLKEIKERWGVANEN